MKTEPESEPLQAVLNLRQSVLTINRDSSAEKGNLSTERGKKMKHKRSMIAGLSAIGALCMNLEIAAAQGGGVSGMYVFPKGKQTQEQQRSDEGQCYNTAVEMTGYDPSAPPSSPPAQSQGAPAGSGARGALRGAAGGAAMGAAMGAIAGDAGKGAAMGAAGGGLLGGVRGRQQGQQQQAAQQQATQQQQQAHRQEYQRAFTACMEARGYSVK